MVRQTMREISACNNRGRTAVNLANSVQSWRSFPQLAHGRADQSLADRDQDRRGDRGYGRERERANWSCSF